MTNLQRKTAKIFAENAPLTAVGQFGSALNGTKVNTTNIDEIQALPAYTEGWTSAVVTIRNYPTIAEMNGVMKVMSYQTAYTLQKGVPEWDSATTYYTGDICKAVGSGVLYVSRSDNNLNHSLSDETYWREYQPSASELPATNYIATMAGSPTYSGNTITLPAMTLYIPNGRSGDNTLISNVVNLANSSYTITPGSDGEYTLFYNNTNNNLHLAGYYLTRSEIEPVVGANGDVWYSLDNKMYVVESTNPNYTISEGVTVSEAGIVSELGTLSFTGMKEIPSNPTLNLKFTTGTDITNSQTLFSTPYAVGTIENGDLNIQISSFSYGVDYHSIIYTGNYTLNGNETLYSYNLAENTVYSSSALQLGLTLYTDENLSIPYGTVTALTGENITASSIETVYDGAFSLVTSGTYYTYLMGSTNYYTSEPLANGVVVYTDTTLQTVFGTATDVEASNVLIQKQTILYQGGYVTNPAETVYKYTIGETTIYSSGVLIPGLIVYTDPELINEYGVCENVTTSNVVIHSISETSGYVAAQGTGAVAANVPIYSDVDLQNQIATSTGANAVYTGTSNKSSVGNLTYTLAASTAYTGNLSFTGTSYNLILNDLSASLLSSRAVYISTAPSIVLGGTNSFEGTFDLTETNMPNVWVWNGFNTVTPDWQEASLCVLGTVTITDGTISALNIDYPIELVKMSDLDRLNIQGGSSRNIGEIVTSTLPLTDAGLHLLDGSLLQGGGIYNSFVSYIADLYETNSTASYFATEEDWQASVSSYGVCAKYVYNSVDNTVRLPKITGLIEGTVDTNALGQLVEAGLPALTVSTVGEHAHTGTTSTAGAHNHYNGCADDYTTNFVYGGTADQMPGYATQSLGLDGGGVARIYQGITSWSGDHVHTFTTAAAGAHTHTLSGSGLGNSNTVQPQTVKAFVYVVVATSVKEDIVVDIDNIATDLNAKADKADTANNSLSNLTAEGEKHFVNKNQISNCILEVPQRIKLEFVNGVLTLKAGSQLLQPDGFEADGTTRKFKYKNIESDMVFPSIAPNNVYQGSIFIDARNDFTNTNTYRLDYYAPDNCGVGPSFPAVPREFMRFWNTSDNKLYIYYNSTWRSDLDMTFPIADGTINTTSITSLDNVYNTVSGLANSLMVKEGVKLLMPNGLNADGTLNNIEYIVPHPMFEVINFGTSGHREYMLTISSDGVIGNLWREYYFYQTEAPVIESYIGTAVWYNPATNKTTIYTSGTPAEKPLAVITPITAGSTYVTSVNQRTTLNLLKQADKSVISGWGMPSTRGYQLTLGVSGSTYEAPANGWFYMDKIATAAGQELNIENKGAGCYTIWSSASNQALRLMMPCSAKSTITITYSAAGNTIWFGFKYAEGEDY